MEASDQIPLDYDYQTPFPREEKASDAQVMPGGWGFDEASIWLVRNIVCGIRRSKVHLSLVGAFWVFTGFCISRLSLFSKNFNVLAIFQMAEKRKKG